MNSVKFRWDYPGRTEVGELRVFVDGVDLAQLVQPWELPFADAEGQPEMAGQYVGLVRGEVPRYLVGYFVTDQTGTTSRLAVAREIPLLGCECGVDGCWPLEATVTIDAAMVRWSDFRQPRRPETWNYAGFGPFVFDRAQYEAAAKTVESSL